MEIDGMIEMNYVVELFENENGKKNSLKQGMASFGGDGDADNKDNYEDTTPKIITPATNA